MYITKTKNKTILDKITLRQLESFTYYEFRYIIFLV